MYIHLGIYIFKCTYIYYVYIHIIQGAQTGGGSSGGRDAQAAEAQYKAGFQVGYESGYGAGAPLLTTTTLYYSSVYVLYFVLVQSYKF